MTKATTGEEALVKGERPKRPMNNAAKVAELIKVSINPLSIYNLNIYQ